MIRWILKGILRDKTRSLFPFLVVSVGVTLMIYMFGFMEGIFMGMIDTTAQLDTGHLRLVNKPFYDEEHLVPMDRALAGQAETQAWLQKKSDPRVQWSPRIRWGAILDVPDDQGETRKQTPVRGMALNMIDPQSPERNRLDLEKSVVEGKVPARSGEMLVGYKLAHTLELKVGDTVTVLGQNFDGGMATDNYRVSGLIRFGVTAMDKKMVLIDLADAQRTFYMEDMVTDWLGYLPLGVPYTDYVNLKSELQNELQIWAENPPKDWARDDQPIVLTVLDQRNLGELAYKYELVKAIIVGIFLFLMVLVLWNAGLINGIHRYGEMGLLLALGQTQKNLVVMFAAEAFLIGVLGSLVGCIVGGLWVFYLQEFGLNMGGIFEQTGIMFNDVVRARLSVKAFIYGIVPGVISSVFGNFIANIAVFKRSVANLFRELEAG